MASHDELRDLTARILRRDEAAARRLVEQLGPDLRRIVHAYPTLHEDSDDLLQDIFARIFDKLPGFRGDAPLLHWASRIARHACIDQLRHKNARPEQRMSDLTEEQRTLLQDIVCEESRPSADAASTLLDQLLATLRPLDAWLLREVELAQRTLTEVAQEAGWNIGLAAVRLFRARQRLKRAFQQLEPSTP
ncbi:MAG: RNA polymerase sigma factor [Verrucomicrobiaceae bacterium]|nr:RNA polymerase sigma factor [Verrucomicrobiaceae bacterium]